MSVNSRRLLYWRCPESEFDADKASHKWKCSISDMIHVYHQQCPFCNSDYLDGDVVKRLVESTSYPKKVVVKNRDEQLKPRNLTQRGRIRRYSVEDIETLFDLL